MPSKPPQRVVLRLTDLFAYLFPDAAHVKRMLLRLPNGATLVQELPGPTVSLQRVHEACVDQLYSNGMITGELFDILREMREGCKTTVDECEMAVFLASVFDNSANLRRGLSMLEPHLNIKLVAPQASGAGIGDLERLISRAAKDLVAQNISLAQLRRLIEIDGIAIITRPPKSAIDLAQLESLSSGTGAVSTTTGATPPIQAAEPRRARRQIELVLVLLMGVIAGGLLRDLTGAAPPAPLETHACPDPCPAIPACPTCPTPVCPTPVCNCEKFDYSPFKQLHDAITATCAAKPVNPVAAPRPTRPDPHLPPE